MGGMTAGRSVPPVEAYYAGEAVRFIHTGTSNPDIAKLLSDMMTSPVLVVP